jgi:phytoene synthase
MMCVLMRVRDANALARACDLGVAMQLTNIARDVGEDARAGRIYLPLDWLRDAGVDHAAFLADPQPSDAIRTLTKRLLAEAGRLYRRSEAGINALPLNARLGIWSARLIYDGIGSQVRRQRFDSISARAHTSTLQKLGWMTQAAGLTAVSLAMPKSALIYADPLQEVAFLVDAASRKRPDSGRTKAVLDILTELGRQQSRIEEGRQRA